MSKWREPVLAPAMALEPWMYGLLVAVAGVHLFVVVVASYYRWERVADGAEPAAEGEAVSCASCGTDNDPEYRFCRRCVTELPGSIHPGGTAATPAGRTFI